MESSSPVPTVSPRTQLAESRRLADFETMDILPNMDRKRLRGVHEEFMARGGVMDCPTFVSVMLAYLPDELVIKTPMLPTQSMQYGSTITEKKKRSDVPLISRLNGLFKEVDTNGSGLTTWGEVSAFDPARPVTAAVVSC